MEGRCRESEDQNYSEEETERRAEAAIKRALNTPPKPRKPSRKEGKSPAKPARLRRPD